MERSTNAELAVARNRVVTVLAGIAWLAVCGALIALNILAVRVQIPDTRYATVTVVGIFVWAAVMLGIGVLCLRNAFFPYVVLADETGIYDFSGFFHGGFVAWSDVRNITLGSGSAVTDVLDALSGDAAYVTVHIKDPSGFSKRQNVLKRIMLFFDSGCIKIKTLCARAKKREVYAMLAELARQYIVQEKENGKG